MLKKIKEIESKNSTLKSALNNVNQVLDSTDKKLETVTNSEKQMSLK